ncbi:hypothetical protein J2T18_001286 [Paenibacillus polymyxa]|uniref:hypothetical protein n=1 Tax=Paenibacillus polymyxa TaxID=1406 RepID=UPI0027932630|nr:hypothetical protein [Paenibacillus polymyxa]MDQ0047014.1 hypothetical protein [Paenibacillus polymyxa]
MKKLKNTAIILTGVLALTAVAPLAASATPSTGIETNDQSIHEVEINSPSDYIKWLKGKDGAEETLQQFSDLSESDQDKFVKYINDPEINKTLVDAMATSNGEKVSLYGGDVTVTATQEQSKPVKISPQVADYAVSQRATSTILGVDVVQVSERVEYRVEGTSSNQRVSQVLNGGGTINRYWVPMGRMDVKDDKGYVNSSGKLAVQRSVFTTSFVHPKLGATIGTNTFVIYGNVKGQLDSWVFN